MGAYHHQAMIALQHYLSRGDDALAKFAAGSHDDAIKVLRWRKAAFYSFKVAEFLEAKAGFDITEEPGLVELWRSIKEQDEKIDAAIEHTLSSLRDELGWQSEVRKKIGKFHSGSSESFLRFQNTV